MPSSTSYSPGFDFGAYIRSSATDLNHSYYASTRGADGELYKQGQAAEAHLVRAQKEAEATLIAKQKEAEGVSAMAKAYGELAGVMGGPQGLLQFLMLQQGTYEKLAAQNAKAVSGLQPKISVWNTGEGGAADAGAPIRNLMQSLPPLLQTVQEQTGIQPPSWLASMPPQQGQQQQQQGEASGKEVMVNGQRK